MGVKIKVILKVVIVNVNESVHVNFKGGSLHLF